MKKVINSFWGISVVLMVTSCRHDLQAGAYIDYMQQDNNGLKKTIRIDNWEYTMQYKPYDYIALLETKGAATAGDIKKREADLKGTAWFNITFKLIDGQVSPLRYKLSSRDEYDSRYRYFLNDAMHSIQLIYDNRDTLYPAEYLFENNFNLTPQETMVVGFRLPEQATGPQKEMQLSYNDQLFKNGIIKADFKRSDLESIPNLIY